MLSQIDGFNLKKIAPFGIDRLGAAGALRKLAQFVGEFLKSIAEMSLRSWLQAKEVQDLVVFDAEDLHFFGGDSENRMFLINTLETLPAGHDVQQPFDRRLFLTVLVQEI